MKLFSIIVGILYSIIIFFSSSQKKDRAKEKIGSKKLLTINVDKEAIQSNQDFFSYFYV